MIRINVNETPLDIEDSNTITQLLEITNTPLNGIAIAINSAIVSKNEWNTHLIKPNDHILIIQATQGG
jgi:sulfur carrier protein